MNRGKAMHNVDGRRIGAGWKSVDLASNFLTALGLGQPSRSFESRHARQGRSVFKKNKPDLPQRRRKASRNSWQPPGQEKEGHQQQDAPQACGTHAESPGCRGWSAAARWGSGGAGRPTGERCPQQTAGQTASQTPRRAGPGLYPELRGRGRAACEGLGGSALGGVLVPNPSSGESRQGSN